MVAQNSIQESLANQGIEVRFVDPRSQEILNRLCMSARVPGMRDIAKSQARNISDYSGG